MRSLAAHPREGAGLVALRVVALCVVALVRCAGEERAPAPPEDWQPQALPLTEMTWSATPAEVDPFSSRTGRASAPCASQWPLVEGSFLEFITRGCSAMTVEAPLGFRIPAGVRVRALLSHTIVVADEPATGYMGIAFGEEVVVLHAVTLPGPAQAYTLEGTLRQAASPGAMLRLHVSNHGANSWRFHRVELE